MFDTLTPAERTTLRATLYRGGCKFAQAGHHLSGAGLANPVGTPERNILMTEGRRFYAAMYDLHELRADVQAA